MAKVKLNEVTLPSYDIADVSAIQAVLSGTAEEDQQRRAMKWIIESAANMYGFQYYPNDRDTNFALGRAFVGQIIVGVSKLNISALRRKENV